MFCRSFEDVLSMGEAHEAWQTQLDLRFVVSRISELLGITLSHVRIFDINFL